MKFIICTYSHFGSKTDSPTLLYLLIELLQCRVDSLHLSNNVSCIARITSMHLSTSRICAVTNKKTKQSSDLFFSLFFQVCEDVLNILRVNITESEDLKWTPNENRMKINFRHHCLYWTLIKLKTTWKTPSPCCFSRSLFDASVFALDVVSTLPRRAH